MLGGGLGSVGRLGAGGGGDIPYREVQPVPNSFVSP